MHRTRTKHTALHYARFQRIALCKYVYMYVYQTSSSSSNYRRFAKTPKTATRKIPSFPSFGRLSYLAQLESTSRRATLSAVSWPSVPKKTFFPSGTKIMKRTPTSAFKLGKDSRHSSPSMITAPSSTKTTNRPCVTSHLSETPALTCSPSRNPPLLLCLPLQRLASSHQQQEQRKVLLSMHPVALLTSRPQRISRVSCENQGDALSIVLTTINAASFVQHQLHQPAQLNAGSVCSRHRLNRRLHAAAVYLPLRWQF
jgi:hypothetical protein